MEKETEVFARNRGEASRDGFGFFVACAAMSLLESFAFSFHLPSLREGDLGLTQILHLGVREDGLLLLLLAVAFFGGWMLARRLNVSLAVSRNKTIAALSVLFALIIVVGRAFSVDEVGVGSYGTFGTVVASKGRILLSVAMFVGLALLFFNALALLFHALDGARRLLSVRSALHTGAEEAGGGLPLAEAAPIACVRSHYVLLCRRLWRSLSCAGCHISSAIFLGAFIMTPLINCNNFLARAL